MDKKPPMKTINAENETLGESVRAVDRALDVLLAFPLGQQKISASDLLKRVNLSRPTLYRLLRTLENRGFVISTGEPQRFSLGPSVAQLANVWSSSLDLPRIAWPMMQELWIETNETVALLIHSGPVRVCVSEIPSPHPLCFKRGVGHSEKVTMGASGRAILAFVENADGYLLDLQTHLRDPYLRELERIRRDGYAVSRDELIQGATAIAAPVFFPGQKVVGSLVVYGPTARTTEERTQAIAQQLLRQSRKLSLRLGAT